MKRIVVIGGGAAGMAAALSAARENPAAQVTILEGKERLGKKLLVTGNGRCNLSNRRIAPDCYHTGGKDRLAAFLEHMGPGSAEALFARWGLLCSADEAGRIYPYCRQASMVLDVLLLALCRAGIAAETNCTVTELVRRSGGFILKTEQGERFFADAVILTTGGRAAPKQGVTGVGYRLAKACGHSVLPLYPCLVPLRCAGGVFRGLKGIRAQAELTLRRGGRFWAAERGEVQFTDYGLSGIPAMQLSCFLGEKTPPDTEISVDFFPDWEKDAVEDLLRRRAEEHPRDTLEVLLLGLIHKRLLYAVMKSTGLERLSRTADTLSEREVAALAAALKDWRFPVEGPRSWDEAQVTGGGVPLAEVDERLMSVYEKELYLAGEVLDVTGICGGYNLHWAWCSGALAGAAAAREEA